jgi:hypothetical protein
MTLYNQFVPANQPIASITNANPGVVTTSQAHGYLTGLLVRLFYPTSFGMPEANNQVFTITVVSTTTFSLGVNTTTYQPFTVASTKQIAQVIPVAEIASILTQAVVNNKNILPEL